MAKCRHSPPPDQACTLAGMKRDLAVVGYATCSSVRSGLQHAIYQIERGRDPEGNLIPGWVNLTEVGSCMDDYRGGGTKRMSLLTDAGMVGQITCFRETVFKQLEDHVRDRLHKGQLPLREPTYQAGAVRELNRIKLGCDLMINVIVGADAEGTKEAEQ